MPEKTDVPDGCEDVEQKYPYPMLEQAIISHIIRYTPDAEKEMPKLRDFVKTLFRGISDARERGAHLAQKALLIAVKDKLETTFGYEKVRDWSTMITEHIEKVQRTIKESRKQAKETLS